MKKTAFRTVSFLLAAMLLLCGAAGLLATALTNGGSPDDRLIVHYDFAGDTLAEQLRNKAADATTGALTLGSTAGLSYIENGVAHIDSAAGNHLTAPLGSAVQNAAALTVVIENLRAAGFNLKSLAIIESAEPGHIVFRDDD